MQAHKDWDFVDTFTEEEKGRYRSDMTHPVPISCPLQASHAALALLCQVRFKQIV